MSKRAIIIGAGPAGLTAALEFLRKTDVKPIILEASQEIGGISRTIRYKGNRMDIGGHRFFSKSDRVMQWWMDLMPPDISQDTPTGVQISYQGKERVVAVPAHLPEEPPLRGLGPLSHETEAEADAESQTLEDIDAVVVAPPPDNEDLVMLVRPRKSRIYYLRKFFDYPIKLSGNTLENLGPVRMAKIGVSYVMSRVSHQGREKPRRLPHQSLRPRALPNLLQELYRKSLGHTMRQDFRRVGSAAHQGSLPYNGPQALRKESFLTQAEGHRRRKQRHSAKRYRHLAHRTLPLSQVRSRPAMGARRRKSYSHGR